MARRRGRPAKPGERYACGKLKSAIEPIAPALWQRIASEAKKKMIDERLGTELGRCFFHGELTSPQIAAGFRLAEIYGAFERAKGKRRSCASPSYNSGQGDHSLAEELLEPDTLKRLEDQIQTATETFKKLHGDVSAQRKGWFDEKEIPRYIRNALEELCVEDRAISWLLLPEIRDVLDQLGFFFGFTTARQAQKKSAAAAASARAPTLQQDTLAKREPNIDRVYWIQVLRKVLPHLDEKEIGHVYETQAALKQRELVRRARGGTRDKVVPFPRVRTTLPNADKPILKINAVIADE